MKSHVPLNAVTARATPKQETRECFRLALESLQGDGSVLVTGEKLRSASHRPQWLGRFAGAREGVLAALKRSGLSSPGKAELAKQCGLAEGEVTQVLDALVDAEEVMPLAPDIFLHPDVAAESRDKVRRFIEESGSLSIPQARDLLGASRKYLLPFLERLDAEGVTVRTGDMRRLR
jgi:selenocysteine-specific elongation factor